MLARVLGLSVLAGLTPLLGAGQSTARYRVDQTTIQETDQTALGGGKRTDTVQTSGFVTLTLTDSAAGRTLHVLVDSIQSQSQVPQLQAALDSLRGTEYHGFIGATGQLTGFHAVTQDSLATDRVEGLVRDLYPALKSKPHQGEQWADTLTRTRDLPGGTMTINSVTTYQATRTEQHEGTRALRVEAASSGTMKGSQEANGQAVTIDGNSKGTGTYYLATDGSDLGGGRDQNTELTVTAAGVLTMPITIHQTTTITRIK